MLRNAGTRVAAGRHPVGRFDKDARSLVRPRRKNGTGRFEAYATAQAVAGSINSVADCSGFAAGGSNVDFVRKFVHTMDGHGMRPRFVLPDRESYAVGITRGLREGRKRFLMPAKKNATAAGAVGGCHGRRRKAVSRFAITASAGDAFTFTRIIKKPDAERYAKTKRRYRGQGVPIPGRYVAFATNASVRQAQRGIRLMPREYRKGWGIGTGYRQAVQAGPRTASPGETCRIILFYASLFMHSMRAIERARAGVNPRGMTPESLVHVTALMMFCEAAGMPIDPGGHIWGTFRSTDVNEIRPKALFADGQ